MNKTVTFSACMPEDLLKWLEETHKALGISRSALLTIITSEAKIKGVFKEVLNNGVHRR